MEVDEARLPLEEQTVLPRLRLQEGGEAAVEDLALVGDVLLEDVDIPTTSHVDLPFSEWLEGLQVGYRLPVRCPSVPVRSRPKSTARSRTWPSREWRWRR